MNVIEKMSSGLTTCANRKNVFDRVLAPPVPIPRPDLHSLATEIDTNRVAVEIEIDRKAPRWTRTKMYAGIIGRRIVRVGASLGAAALVVKPIVDHYAPQYSIPITLAAGVLTSGIEKGMREGLRAESANPTYGWTDLVKDLICILARIIEMTRKKKNAKGGDS
jgi:hypothetical protein